VPLTSIACEHAGLRAVASLNGAKRCPVAVYHLVDGAAERLAVDDINPTLGKEQDALRERLPAEYRDAGRELLTALAEQVMAERLAAKQRADERAAEAADDPRPPAFSDDALALAFTERHADEFRFTAAWSTWQRWDETRWATDHTLAAFDAARQINREAAATATDPKVAAIVSAAKTVAAVERLARADRAHAATVEQWDASPMLLNTPGGTVDLQTGALRPHRRGDFCTKRTDVAPRGEAPLWDDFLNWATAGDAELYAFLRRMFGYCLTGLTTEHALFFNHGGGGNGKGTALNTVTRILGDYAKVSPMETFTASHGDRHPTELRGARLVTAQETEEGRRWAESRIKALTGGDPITARFIRGDFFTFQPEFKLVIAGNHRPQLRNVDAAWRRRFHLIPWTQQASKVNLSLGAELYAEAPGILAWMVQGCLEWQEHGLRPPAIVQDATAEYLEAEDTFAQWIDDCCVRRPGQWASSAELFASWAQWAERVGERPGNAKTFAGAMQSHGIHPQAATSKAKTRGYADVMLKPTLYPAVARAS